jgi:hypothetical protein
MHKRPSVIMRAHTCITVGILLASGYCQAADHPFPPLRDTVCVGADVDRAKLARELLSRFPLSPTATSRPGISLAPMNQLLADMLKMGCAAGCESADKKALGGIHGNLMLFLSGWYAPAFTPEPNGIDPVAYLAGTGVVACGGPETGEAPGATNKATDKSTSHWRVRGRPDQLYIDRSEPAFTTADKAVASFDRDAIADTRTLKTRGYAGYYIDFSDDKVHGTRRQIIPFVGIDRNTVEVGANSQTKATSKDVLYAGAQATFTFDWGKQLATHQVNVLPEYIDDRHNGTRQGVLAVEYLPYIRPWANTFNRFDESRYDLAQWKPVFSLKANTGHYFDMGSSAVKLENYTRVGGKIGIAVTSDNPHVPLDFEVDYVSMKAVSGEHDIDYRTANLTWSLDDNKYVGLTLSYKKGRREDTAVQDDDVTIGLSVKF